MISIVVPLRDEAENIEALVDEVHSVLEPSVDFELICVDDGSEDETLRVLRTLAKRFRRLHFMRHKQGYGQSAALWTGVRAARGEWVVTMDGDGQNDPADITRLIDARDTGSTTPQMVVGWRRRRRDPWAKRVASWIANAAYRFILKDDTPDVGCGLKLFRRDVFLEQPRFDHMHRFLPALIRAQGGRVASVEVRHRARRAGRSKYGVRDRLWVGIVDLLGVMWLQKRMKKPLTETERMAT